MNNQERDVSALQDELASANATIHELLHIIADMNDLQTMAFGEIESIALMVMEATQSPNFSIIAFRIYDVMSNINKTATLASNNISALAEERIHLNIRINNHE